jgi:hypothetical protein
LKVNSQKFSNIKSTNEVTK